MSQEIVSLGVSELLPDDGYAGTLVGRVWLPEGPAVVAIRADGVHDLGTAAPTMAALLASDDPVARVRATAGRRVGSLEEILANTVRAEPDPGLPRLLAPCDLQVLKAAGVTFVDSMLERVIEEQARGDASRAETVRSRVKAVIGENLSAVRPGSAQAAELKKVLIEQQVWSQYLEVGIGPDAEIFTKAPVLSAVGTGAEIGIHPKSEWSNPEPEVVLAVDGRGRIVGASLGNDVNLRDFEGRSALLLSKAKDNNASCAIGPFIRLFDDGFTLDDLRSEDLDLRVEGTDGFVLHGASTMKRISRDPADLAAQTLDANHQYPDGFMLFLGTLFAPTEDRDAPGAGFTHHLGDIVSIRSARLGLLRNRVTTSDRARPWTFGLGALMSNLAARGLL
ncbi:MAG: fumarylacetoacetate hydrolase family protein [Burkholderiaceae bacterium]